MIGPSSLEWRRLLRRLDRLAGTREAAEDALQSAFVRIATFQRHNEVRRPAALLAHTAVNLALDERRRARRAAWEAIDSEAREVHDEQSLQDERLAACERLHRVELALSTMPDRTRTAFLMHRLDGQKYAQISEHLKISVSAVEKHIARAVLMLSDAMQKFEHPL